MGKRGSAVVNAQRAAVWRKRIARHLASKQSVAAFCRNEAVSAWSFYRWRARLRALDTDVARSQRPAPGTSSFIDLGAIAGPSAGRLAAESAAVADPSPANIAVRIDLGCGVVLTLVRH
jgi:hypothetical protein